MNKSLSLLTLTILLFCISAEPYKKVINSISKDALCLDGSSPYFYIHQGTEKNKFLIFFEGGGLCGEVTSGQTYESCYNRSFTDLGSSKYAA